MASQERWGCNATFTVSENGEVEWDDEGAADMPVELETGGPEPEEWWRCPRRPVKDDPRIFGELSRLWNLKEKGFLPYPGSYLEQPNYYVEAMHVVDLAVAEIGRLEDKKRRLKSGDFS